MNAMNAELKVLTALRDQASMMRKSRADAHLGVAAGKWEIFFDEQIERLRKEESQQLVLMDVTGDGDGAKAPRAMGGAQ